MPPLVPRKVPTRPSAQTLGFPAPIGGLNTVAAGTAMPVTDCVSVWNLIPSDAGLRSRLGYREWVTGLGGVADDKVRSLLSFAGSEPSQNRLFATTDSGIWPASSSTTTPVISYSFASTSGNAGYGSGRVVVTSAGHFYIYCDEVNGLHVYSESGGTWTAPTMGGGASQIANVDPANLVHATVFKRRVWFTERDSTSAWYLAAGAIYGSATEFDFGTQFSSGGHLVGLYNWTYDGGSGVDDSLVAISSTGDVVVVNGTDPADPTSFNVRGVWNMGPPPAGRDIAREMGGDLYLLSSLGILPISRLVVGADRSYETAKIANLFNSLMQNRSSSRGWSMHLHPEDNALLVLYPDYSTDTSQQLAQSQSTRGWFRYTGVPMHCAVVWEGRLHFGTQDGRVCVSRGYLDNVALVGSTYEDVEWSLLTSFQQAGGGHRIAVNQLRALLISNGATPSISLGARYDYDESDLGTPSAAAASGGAWGSGLWGTSVWGGGNSSFTIRRGTSGTGHVVAAAIRGTSITRTVLVHLEAAFEVGGWL